MKTFKKLFIPAACVLAGLVAVGITGCKKKYDSPPKNTIPVGDIVTIAQLRAMLSTATPSVKFTTDKSVYATVTMDERNGNLYKNAFIQDNTGAIVLRLMSSGGLYQGDSIRLDLKGTRLDNYNGMTQIDSVNVNTNVVKQKTDVNVNPMVITDLSQLDSSTEGYLVKLVGVEYSSTDLGSTYADAYTQTNASHNLEDCSLNTVAVRTSGYASFANDPLPLGKGSLVGISAMYNGTVQVYVRSMAEVHMDSARCDGSWIYLVKNFDDGSVTSGGWVNDTVSGNTPWGLYGGNVASISNYGNAVACETWLISPSINLSNVTNPILDFQNAYKYTGPALQVYVSTNYTDGSAPSSATWTALNPTLSAGAFAMTDSGPLDLSAYETSNVHIAFKYTAPANGGSTWEVDNITIRGN